MLEPEFRPNTGSYDKLVVTGNVTVASPGMVLSPVAMSGASWAIGDTFNVVQRSASGALPAAH